MFYKIKIKIALTQLQYIWWTPLYNYNMYENLSITTTIIITICMGTSLYNYNMYDELLN